LAFDSANEPSPRIAGDAARFPAVKDGDEFCVHFLFARAEAMMESISTGSGPCRSFVFPEQSAANWIPRLAMVRRTRPISALGLPFSTSTIHCGLTPTLAQETSGRGRAWFGGRE